MAAHPQLPPLALPGTLLMPGFVDAHTHLAQAFGKSLVFGEPSEIFRRIWVPLEGSMDDEAVYLAAKLAALEALRGGFTTVVDAGVRSRHRAVRRGAACTRRGCAACSARSATTPAAAGRPTPPHPAGAAPHRRLAGDG